MQFGLFKALARHGLAAGYINIKGGAGRADAR